MLSRTLSFAIPLGPLRPYLLLGLPLAYVNHGDWDHQLSTLPINLLQLQT